MTATEFFDPKCRRCPRLAEYLDVDPVVIRLLAVISVLFFGFGFFFYVVAIFIIPLDPGRTVTDKAQQATEPRSRRRKGNWSLAFGAVLVIFGALLLLDNFDIFDRGWFRFHFFPWRLFWPLALIGLGIYLVTSAGTVRQTADEMKSWAKKNRLHKSRTEKSIFGVCGGLAEQFNIDPSVVRILFVFAFILSAGMAFLVYLALALILPYDEKISSEANAETSKEQKRSNT